MCFLKEYLFGWNGKDHIFILFYFYNKIQMSHTCYFSPLVDHFRTGMLHILLGGGSTVRHPGHRVHWLHPGQRYITDEALTPIKADAAPHK